MWSGEYRRSQRIVELGAQKEKQAKNRNKGIVIHEVRDEEELDRGEDDLKEKGRRKKVKVRTVQDLIVNSVEYKVQKTDTKNDEDQHSKKKNDEDHLVKAAVVPSGAALPEKSKLELLLGILQRRDTLKIFAEPVNGEEVKYYYDVIKEPMDFGTIAKKLNEGSYQNLNELEHDVFLISDNALLFNASNTVYYRQARALKELATRLFHALKTDPENFETEASIRRMGASRRTKDIGKGADTCQVDKRQTYRPWNLSESGSLISAVYNGPKQLELDEKPNVRYGESLYRFSKDLGPVAKKVAMKKAMEVWNLNTNGQFQAPEMPIPSVSSSAIKVSPSFVVPPRNNVSIGVMGPTWRPTSQVLTGLNSDQTVDYLSGIGSFHPGKEVSPKVVVADVEGSRNNVELGGLSSYCSQEPTITPYMSSLLQEKGKLDSLCMAPPLEEEWFVSLPQENIMGSKALIQEKFQPQNLGGSSSRSAAANRYQKQTPLQSAVLALPFTGKSHSRAAAPPATDGFLEKHFQRVVLTSPHTGEPISKADVNRYQKQPHLQSAVLALPCTGESSSRAAAHAATDGFLDKHFQRVLLTSPHTGELISKAAANRYQEQQPLQGAVLGLPHTGESSSRAAPAATDGILEKHFERVVLTSPNTAESSSGADPITAATERYQKKPMQSKEPIMEWKWL